MLEVDVHHRAGGFALDVGVSAGDGVTALFGRSGAGKSTLVGMIAGVALALVVIFFNVQKWVIVAITSFFGSAAIIGSLMLVLGRISIEDLGTNAVGTAIEDSFLWLLFYLVLAVLGIASQIGIDQTVELEPPESTFLSS